MNYYIFLVWLLVTSFSTVGSLLEHGVGEAIIALGLCLLALWFIWIVSERRGINYE